MIIGLLTELAEENLKLIEQYADYEHTVPDTKTSGKTVSSKRKRQSAIEKHFHFITDKKSAKSIQETSGNNKRIESQKRKIFNGKNGTLNDRLGAGMTAGNNGLTTS